MADPALLFHEKADRAGTHVLLIGIGDYPWLDGGDKCSTAAHRTNAMGMGQLGAPSFSMRSMADWFLDGGGFNNPDRPLASLAMLLSEPEAATYQHANALPRTKPLPRGTIAEVQAAVTAWIERASGRRDNALVLAFCGHGVQSGNPVLLCRDYGKNVQSRFQGAIDFEQFRIALSTRQPDFQLLFVDACRTPDVDKSQLGQVTPGNPLLDLLSLTTRDNAPAAQSVHFATSLYTSAWGRDDEQSLFSGAVLEALAGGGADQNADWWVTTSRLNAALATYLVRISRDEGISQNPTAQTQHFRISKPGPIAVPLYVSSAEPAIWAETVKISALRGNALQDAFDHQPDPVAAAEFRECALRLVNPTQRVTDVIYDVQATFPGSSAFIDCVEQIIAYPPEVTCQLQVSKRP